MIILRVFKVLKISTLNSRTFRTFPGSVRTLKIYSSRVEPHVLTDDYAAFMADVTIP